MVALTPLPAPGISHRLACFCEPLGARLGASSGSRPPKRAAPARSAPATRDAARSQQPRPPGLWPQPKVGG